MHETRIKDALMPVIESEWNDFFAEERHIHQLENQILPAYLRKCRWFGGKSRIITAVKIYQHIPLPGKPDTVHFLILKVRYPDGPTEMYTLPLSFIPESRFHQPGHAVLCRLVNPVKSGYLVDGMYDELVHQVFMGMMLRSVRIEGAHYPISAESGPILQAAKAQGVSKVLEADQSNSAVLFGDQYFLKLFRKVEYMVNPDHEIVSFLTHQDQFHHLPRLAGSISVHHPEKPPMLVMMLQEYVPNEGDAWKYFSNSVSTFLNRAVEADFHTKPLPIKPHTLSLNLDQTPSELLHLMGTDVHEKARLLGIRTAEMHLALADSGTATDFAPQPVDAPFQHQLLRKLLHLVDTRFDLLQSNLPRIHGRLHDDAEAMLAGRERVVRFFETVLRRPMEGQRIRIHGDYHLGQVLMRDGDFYILDFEGEPDRPHAERRETYPPLKDVAGMMRSFRYAAYSVIFRNYGHDEALTQALMPVADVWYHYVSRYYLGAYLERCAGHPMIPSEDKVNDLLQIYSFKKAIYELGYEINNRPDWTIIPLQSLVKFVRHYLDA